MKSLCFYQSPERGTSSLGAACFWRLFRLSVAGCFGVGKDAFWRLAAPPAAAAAAAAAGPAGPAAELALFLPESRRDVKPRGKCFWRSCRPSGPWCFTVSEAPARTSLWSCFEGMGATLWSYSFLSVQKAVLGSGARGNMFLEVVPVWQRRFGGVQH